MIQWQVTDILCVFRVLIHHPTNYCVLCFHLRSAEHGNNENDEGADRTEVEHIDCLHANICRRFLKVNECS